MAGDKLGRPTYAMDVDPIYVEVARRRWEAFTGQTAVRLTPERAPTRRRAARAMTRRRPTARRTPARGGQQGYEPPVTRMRRDERILELALERWSQRQIAAEVGLTQGGVSKALRRIFTRQLATLTEETEASRVKLVLLAERRPRRSSSSTRSPPRAIRPTWRWNSGPTSSPRSCSACTTPPRTPSGRAATGPRSSGRRQRPPPRPPLVRHAGACPCRTHPTS